MKSAWRPRALVLAVLACLAAMMGCSPIRTNVYVRTEPDMPPDQKWLREHSTLRERPWHDSDLVRSMANDTLLEAVGIGGGKKLIFPDVQALLDCAHGAPPCRERVDFVSKIRFTKVEKEGMQVGPLVYGVLFALIELRHPLNAKESKPYDWRMPLYGAVLGAGVGFAMGFSREKVSVRLRGGNP